VKQYCSACHNITVHNQRKKKDLLVCTKCGEGAGARKKALQGFYKRMFGPHLRVSIKMIEKDGTKRQTFFIRNGSSVIVTYNAGKDWMRASHSFDTVAAAADFCNRG